MPTKSRLLSVDEPAQPTSQPFRPFNLPFGEIATDLRLTLELRQSEQQVDNYHQWLAALSPRPLPERIGGD